MATSTVRVLFLGDSRGAVGSVKGLERQLGGLSRAAGIAGKALAVGIVGGLALAVKQAVAFEREMRNVNSIARLSETQFKSLNKQVLSLSKETAQAPKTLAKGLYDIVSSGFKANDAIKILRVSAKAASAGLTDTATATKAINAALNAYHLQATDARKVSDVLFQTVNKGVLTFEELAQNMGDLVPAAAPLGVTLEEVGAAIATITLQGVPAAEAATRVKNVMLQLASPSKALSKLLKEQGFASGEAAIQAKGFVGVLELLNTATAGNVTKTAALTPEIRALLGVVGLTGKNLDTYLANLRSMEDAHKGAGATAKAFAEQSKSVSFQWQKAKAALAAAAIPLGNLLLPLLARGAGAVTDFADEIAQRMPEIRDRFGSLASGVRDVAGALAQVAGNQAGQAAIVGILAAFATTSAIGKAQQIAAGISAVGLASTVAVGAVGVLAGGLFYLATAADKNALALEGLRRAMGAAAAAGRDLTQTRLRERQAAAAVETAELALERARLNLTQVTKTHTRTSLEYREAANSVKLAEQALTQAKQNAKTAAEDANKAELGRRDALRASSKATQEAYEAAKRLVLQEQTSAYSSNQDRLAKKGVRDALDRYADAVRDAEKAAGRATGPTKAYRDAVKSLFLELGRLPRVKEIDIYVRTHRNAVVGRTNPPPSANALNRASGGFIPQTPGSAPGIDSVPALLTPGEVVLNRAQQEKLGGPAYLAGLFGFSGARSGRFAAGGVAGRSPHSKVRQRAYQRSSKAARKTLAAVAAVNLREQDLDRAYGQMARGFDISQEEFIVTGADGNERFDAAAVSKRLGEIGQLVMSRQRMVALIDTEKKRLQQAIEALRKAIDELMAAMKAEREAAAEDARQAAALTKQLRAEEKAADEARGRPAKTKEERAARAAEVRRHVVAAKNLRNQIGDLGKSERRHRDQAGVLSGTADEFRQALTLARGDLFHGVAFDRRDVQLDIAELLAQAREIEGVRAAAPATEPTGAAGGDGGGGGGILPPAGADDGTVEALRRTIEDLTRRLAGANLAIGVQGVQLPVIGSFQRGTIHVPSDMVAQLHAGEQVIRPGVVPAASSQSGSTSHVISVDLGPLNDLIDQRVVQLTPDIELRIGVEADRRRRAGTF